MRLRAAVHRRAGDSGGFDRAIGRTGGLEHYDILAKEVVSFGKKIGGDEILVLTYCQIEIGRFFKTSKAEQAGENHMLANGLPPHTEGGPSDHADRSGAAGRGKNADLARAGRSEPRTAPIIAKYAGRCSRCEKPICVGDEIRSHRTSVMCTITAVRCVTRVTVCETSVRVTDSSHDVTDRLNMQAELSRSASRSSHARNHVFPLPFKEGETRENKNSAKGDKPPAWRHAGATYGNHRSIRGRLPDGKEDNTTSSTSGMTRTSIRFRTWDGSSQQKSQRPTVCRSCCKPSPELNDDGLCPVCFASRRAIGL